MTTKKGGRPATGSIKWQYSPEYKKDCWHGRITEADRSRPYVPLDPEIPESDREAALAAAVIAVKTAKEYPLQGTKAFESLAKWWERFHTHKERIGLASVDDMRGRAKNWILPTIGAKAPRDVTREDIETIVRRLDRAILAWQAADGDRGEGRLSASSAANVWGDLVHAFDEMVSSKDPTLRVLTVSPCANVRGPETAPDREGPILYSDEILALLRGNAVDQGEADVPLYRRHVWAMAIYGKGRRSETAALMPEDVDLAHQTITISKQVERKSKKRKATGIATKKTKTQRTRTIDIEPNLLPLLKLLVARPEGRGGRLLRVPPSEDYAEVLRKDLWTVGARDPRLHTEDSMRTKMTGHCLRDTGLTHMAVRGDSPIVIQWCGGHTDFKMTQGYIDRGRVEARRIGLPLPPLPPEVLGGASTGFGSEFGRVQTGSENLLRFRDVGVTPTGIEEDPFANEQLRVSIENLALSVATEGRVESGSEIQTSRASKGIAGDSVGSAVPNDEPPSVDMLRRKLDAAIVAEAWEAVKAIRERIVEVERHAAGNVTSIDAAKRRR